VALNRCVAALDKLKLEGDEQIGVNIVNRTLQEPLRQIAENAGRRRRHRSGKVNDSKNRLFGYNAMTGEYEDLVKTGMIDPTKVVRTALTNAASRRGADAYHRSHYCRYCQGGEGFCRWRPWRHGRCVLEKLRQEFGSRKMQRVQQEFPRSRKYCLPFETIAPNLYLHRIGLAEVKSPINQQRRSVTSRLTSGVSFRKGNK
jgi:hypothetical protein